MIILGFRIFRFYLSVVLASALVSASYAKEETFAGERRKWRHYQSPNFELYSANSDGESRDLLHNLELVHASFLEFFALKVRLPLPVTVFYFGDEDDFRAYSPAAYGTKHSFTGFYVARPDRATILMAPRDQQKQAQQTIFHEYVHHLFSITEERPPTWFNEGMAEIFSTLEDDLGRLYLGRPKPGRVAELQREGLMPLEEMFAVTHASPVYRAGVHTGQFYSQSWALLHYCYLGQTDLPREKLQLFLRVARAPQFAEEPGKLRAVFRELLGIDYPDLARRLERYVNTGRYQGRILPLPTLPDRKTFARRDVPFDEAQLRLAEIAVRVNRSPEGKLALLHAADRHPNDVRIHETLGTLALGEGDAVAARERWERALELGSDNPAVYHELARLRTQLLMAQFDPYYRMPDELSVHLRALLKRSIAAAPEQTTAYETLAWVEATSAECEIANVNVVQQRFPLLKTKDRTVVYLAMVRHRRNDNEGALRLLDDLPKTEPDHWSTGAAELLRAKIEGRKPQRAPGDKPRSKTPPVKIRLNPDALKSGS